jgi:hypothetical protein
VRTRDGNWRLQINISDAGAAGPHDRGATTSDDGFTGKRIVVGLTFQDRRDGLVGHGQYHGRIARIDREEGIVVERLDGGGLFNLPPDTRLIRPATLREYRLTSTGEVVRDPDFELVMTITVPDSVADAMRDGRQPMEPELRTPGTWTTEPPPGWDAPSRASTLTGDHLIRPTKDPVRA